MSECETNCIRIWVWDDAPEEYRQFSSSAGDPGWLRYYVGHEEWLAHIPARLVDQMPRIFEGAMPYSGDVYPTQEFNLPDKSRVIIGADPYPLASSNGN